MERKGDRFSVDRRMERLKEKKLRSLRGKEIKGKYYSCENTYELDAEIAADLEFFLGTRI